LGTCGAQMSVRTLGPFRSISAILRVQRSR
jgi:hypothetical protein